MKDKQAYYTTRTHCRVCGEPDRKPPLLLPFATLPKQPLTDVFLEDSEERVPEYPLSVGFCPNCKLVQHQVIVDDSKLFGDDYAFFTGASPSSLPYFETYAKNTKIRFPKQSKGFVVEIASNDGTLLRHFRDTSAKVLGIEPAGSTVALAIQQGVPTLKKLFTLNTAMHVAREEGRADLIMANNVVAHTDELLNFLQGVCSLLDNDGVFIAEVQYFPHLLFNNAFDHLYHEHRSFFSFSSLLYAFNKAGLYVFSVMEADTQGGSIRVFAQRATGKEPVTPSVERLLNFERDLELDKVETYQGFQSRITYLKKELIKVLEELKLQGKTVYGFGASAKGNTLLNTFGITPDLVPYIVDKTPYKIGKYAPGSKIPVVSETDVPKPDYYLVLVWNYLKGILEREKTFRLEGGKFIVPIPNVQIL